MDVGFSSTRIREHIMHLRGVEQLRVRPRRISVTKVDGPTQVRGDLASPRDGHLDLHRVTNPGTHRGSVTVA